MNHIGIWAPSRHTEGFEGTINKGVARLSDVGFQVTMGATIKTREGSASGLVSGRVDDLVRLWSNETIDTIWCALGGDAANQLLPHMPYDLIKRSPKNFIGFSDITHLLWAITKMTGIPTWHGPNVKDLSQLTDQSWNWNLNSLKPEVDQLNYPAEWEIIRPGKAEGKLWTGNLFVVNALAATPYLPDLSGSILCIEDIDDGLMAVEYQLNLLALTGILSKIGGLVIGHIKEDQNTIRERLPLSDMIRRIIEPYNWPVIKVDYFGHDVSDFYMMPESGKAVLDTLKKTFFVQKNSSD